MFIFYKSLTTIIKYDAPRDKTVELRHRIKILEKDFISAYQ